MLMKCDMPRCKYSGYSVRNLRKHFDQKHPKVFRGRCDKKLRESYLRELIGPIVVTVESEPNVAMSALKFWKE